MKKTVKIILIVVALVVVAVIGGAIYLVNAYTYDMNEKISIKNENIDLVVKSVSTQTIEEPSSEALGRTSWIEGDYFKVEVEITNNGTEDYEWASLNFGLYDADENGGIPSLILDDSDVPDLLPSKIPANQTVRGCLYFEKDRGDGKYIQDVLAHFDYSSYAPGKVTKYIVKLY